MPPSSFYMTDSQQYEHLIKHMLETRASESLERFEVFSSRHYVGKSGHDHQIDVSMVFYVAGVKILVLVEARITQERSASTTFWSSRYGSMISVLTKASS